MNFVIVLSIATILARNLVCGQSCGDCQAPLNQNRTLWTDVKFRQANLVPCVMPTSPLAVLKVRWSNAAAELGNCLTPAETVLAPFYEYEDADPNTNYTLFVGDADWTSPSAPVFRFGVINLCLNIQGSRLISQTSGYSIAPYCSPAPSCGSGNHRIVVLLMAQTGVIDPTDAKLIEWSVNRVRLDLDELRSRFSLGDLVAGNFWITSLNCCNNNNNNNNNYCRS